MYPFGYGLSYSDFLYSDFKLNKTKIKVGQSIEASINIKNNSKIAGDEVVQIYLSLKESNFRVPNSKLIGIKRIQLQAGETKNIKLLISPENMKKIDKNGKLVVNKFERNIIRRIKNFRSRGYSWRRISNRLNEEGVKSKEGNLWYDGSLYNMMRSYS